MEKQIKKDILRKTVSRSEAKEVMKNLGKRKTNVNLNQFREGLKVESEHKDFTNGSPITTGKIALAHLKEIPDYYTRLKKMEKGAENKK